MRHANAHPTLVRAPRKINASILIVSGRRYAASAQKIEAFIFLGTLSGGIIDAVRGNLAKVLVDKVINLDFERIALWAIIRAIILIIPNEFLLFGINRDDRLASCLRRLDFRAPRKINASICLGRSRISPATQY